MALKVKHTEMNGDTSRWLTREEAKVGAKKERRRIDIAELLSEFNYLGDWHDEEDNFLALEEFPG